MNTCRMNECGGLVVSRVGGRLFANVQTAFGVPVLSVVLPLENLNR